MDGKEIAGPPGLDRGIAFQQYGLLPWRTARRTIEFGLQAKGLSAAERRARAEHYLELVGLQRFAERNPHELSGGMNQRVAIARSLAFTPRSCSWASHLPLSTRRLGSHFRTSCCGFGKRPARPILFITHGFDEAIHRGQPVAVLRSRPGRIKKIVDVEIDRTVEDVRSEEGFRALRHHIWSLPHDEVVRARLQTPMIHRLVDRRRAELRNAELPLNQ